jgi:hypothetical protein
VANYISGTWVCILHFLNLSKNLFNNLFFRTLTPFQTSSDIFFCRSAFLILSAVPIGRLPARETSPSWWPRRSAAPERPDPTPPSSSIDATAPPSPKFASRTTKQLKFLFFPWISIDLTTFIYVRNVTPSIIYWKKSIHWVIFQINNKHKREVTLFYFIIMYQLYNLMGFFFHD